MSEKPLSVSELITQVKGLLEGTFRKVFVEGEVSNLSIATSGHIYFSLIDNDSLINCALFKNDLLRNPSFKKINNGDKVMCSGSIGLYGKRGTFQIIVKKIAPKGKGDLKEQFELLKKKLSNEGLFDIDQKTPLPKFPSTVAVITAPTGAALQDFINIFHRRAKNAKILVSPAIVQGEKSPKELRKALNRVLEYHVKKKPIDVIVFARGGGSIEDLWAFNDEGLAYDIFNCPVPIVSAIGHEIDYSISDFVADFRAETPSAAAEILSEGYNRIISDFENLNSKMTSLMDSYFLKKSAQVEMANPKKLTSAVWQCFSDVSSKLAALNISSRLYELTRIHEKQQYLDEIQMQMLSKVETLHLELIHRLKIIDNAFINLDPKNVLLRGYAFIKSHKSVISSLKDYEKLPKNALISINFCDGKTDVIKS